MKTQNTAEQKLVDAATETINESLAQLHSELAGIALDILAQNVHEEDDATRNILSDPSTPFLDFIDAVRKVTHHLSTDSGQRLTSKTFGAETLWSLTNGFLKKLTSTKGSESVLRFDVTDRCTGRTVPVALPAMGYSFLADDVRKFVRDLKKFRKVVKGG